MHRADFGRFVRPLGAAAIAALVAAPVFAFGAMESGGFHGGFHGARIAVARPRTISVTPRPPFFTAPRPVRVRVGFVKVRPRDFFHFRDMRGRRDRFDRRGPAFPWGFGGYGTYAVGGVEPVYAAQAAPAPAPPPCPELLTWSPKLHRAIRQDLCDEPPGGLALSGGVTPRG